MADEQAKIEGEVSIKTNTNGSEQKVDALAKKMDKLASSLVDVDKGVAGFEEHLKNITTSTDKAVEKTSKLIDLFTKLAEAREKAATAEAKVSKVKTKGKVDLYNAKVTAEKESGEVKVNTQEKVSALKIKESQEKKIAAEKEIQAELEKRQTAIIKKQLKEEDELYQLTLARKKSAGYLARVAAEDEREAALANYAKTPKGVKLEAFMKEATAKSKVANAVYKESHSTPEYVEAITRKTELDNIRKKDLIDKGGVELEIKERLAELAKTEYKNSSNYIETERSLKQEKIAYLNEQNKRLKQENSEEGKNAKKKKELDDAALKAAKTNYYNARAENEGKAKRGSIKSSFGYGIKEFGQQVDHIKFPGSNVVGESLRLIGASLVSPAEAIRTAFQIGGKAVTQFANDTIEAYTAIEKIKVQMGVVYGSQSQAADAFNEISAYATKSPYGVEQTAEYAVLLKQSGVYSYELLDTLKMIGDVSSGNAEKMKRIANNYAQIEAVGKASMLDMRQFAYAGIPIYKEVAEYLGVSQQTLRKMISDGKVTADVMENVFKKMTSEGGVFFEAVEKGSRTLSARLQNLSDIKSLALAGVGESITNLGDIDGTGGYVSKAIGLGEHLFEWLNKWANGKNIEDSVTKLANGTGRIAEIQELKKLINSNDENKEMYKELLSSLEEEEKTLKSIWSPDVERKVLSESYKTKVEKTENYNKSSYSRDEVNKLEAQVSKLQDEIKGAIAKATSEGIDLLDYNNPFIAEIDAKTKLYDLYVDRLNNINYDNLRNKQENPFGITQEEKLANIERSLEKGTTAFLEGVKKFQGGSDGIISVSSKYKELFDNSPLEKEKREKMDKETIEKYKADAEAAYKVWTSSRFTELDLDSYINNIKTYTDPTKSVGSVKSDYLERVANGYQPVEGAEKDFEILKTNIRDFIKVVQKNVPVLGENSDIWKDAFEYWFDVIDRGSPDEINDAAKEILKSIDFYKTRLIQIGSDGNQAAKKLADNFHLIFRGAEMNFDPKNWDLSIFTEVGKKELQALTDAPLWQRIISSTTGLSTDIMKTDSGRLGGRDVMNMYGQKSERQIVASTIAEIYRTGTLEKAMEFFSFGDIKQLQAKKLVGNEDGKSKTDKPISLGQNLYERQLNFTYMQKDLYSSAISGRLESSIVKAMKSGYENQEKTLVSTFQKMIEEGEEKYAANFESVMQNAFSFYDQIGASNSVDVNGTKYTIKKDSNGVVQFYDEATGLTKSIQELNLSYEGAIDVLNNLRKQAKLNQAELAVAEYRALTKEDLHNQTREAAYSRSFMTNEDLQEIMKLPESQRASVYDKMNTDRRGLFNKEVENAKAKDENSRNSLDKSFIKLDELLSNGIIPDLIEFNSILDAIKGKSNATINSAKDVGNLLSSKDQAEISIAIEKRNLENGFNPLRTLSDAFVGVERKNGNSYAQQKFMENLGFGNSSFDLAKEDLTKAYRNKLSVDGVMDPEKWSEEQWGTAEGIGINRKKFEKGTPEEQEKEMEKIVSLADDIATPEVLDGIVEWENHLKDIESTVKDIGSGMKNIGMNLVSGGITTAFESMGENLKKGNDATNGIGRKMRELGKAAMSNLGSLFTQAGLSLIASDPKANLGMGLALIAAGGLASFASGLMADNDDSDTKKAESEAERLARLKDQLADLLEQAREDAIYYENELRHQTALSLNKSTSGSVKTVKVNDAVIKPNGNIVSTHPDDWLIATKQPGQLVGSSSPNVSINIANNSGQPMNISKRQTTDKDGNINIEAVIVSTVSKYIASSDSDDAFNSRNTRINGKSVVA